MLILVKTVIYFSRQFLDEMAHNSESDQISNDLTNMDDIDNLDGSRLTTREAEGSSTMAKALDCNGVCQGGDVCDEENDESEYEQLDKDMDEISAYLDKMEDWSDSLRQRVLEFLQETKTQNSENSETQGMGND